MLYAYARAVAGHPGAILAAQPDAQVRPIPMSYAHATEPLKRRDRVLQNLNMHFPPIPMQICRKMAAAA